MIALGYYGAEVYDISMPFPTGPLGFAKSRATIRENPGKIGVLGATKRAEVELRILLPKPQFQRAIGNKVRAAERLQEKATSNDHLARTALFSEALRIAQHPFVRCIDTQLSTIIGADLSWSVREADPFRLDPAFYVRELVANHNWLKQIGAVPLSEWVDRREGIA